MIKKIILFLYRVYRSILRYIFTSITKYRVGGYKGKLVVNYSSNIGSNVHLGSNCNFNGIDISYGGDVIIGDNFHSGKDIRIIVQNHNYEGTLIPYDNTFINRNIKIEDNVWIGHNVVILGGITIGEGAIIQAGSVVSNDIPKFAIAGGNPAQTFKYRNEEHYLKLKAEKKFN